MTDESEEIKKMLDEMGMTEEEVVDFFEDMYEWIKRMVETYSRWLDQLMEILTKDLSVKELDGIIEKCDDEDKEQFFRALKEYKMNRR